MQEGITKPSLCNLESFDDMCFACYCHAVLQGHSSSSSSSSSSSPPPRPLRQLCIAVGSAGPLLPVYLSALHRNGQGRTSTGSSRAQWAAPNLTGELANGVGSARLQPGACQKECEKICHKGLVHLWLARASRRVARCSRRASFLLPV